MSVVLLRQGKFLEAHTAIREALYRSPSQIFLELKHKIEAAGVFAFDVVSDVINPDHIAEEFRDAPFRVGSVPRKGRALIASAPMSPEDSLVSEVPLVSCVDPEQVRTSSATRRSLVAKLQ